MAYSMVVWEDLELAVSMTEVVFSACFGMIAYGRFDLLMGTAVSIMKFPRAW